MSQLDNHHEGYRRMSKGELGERLHALQETSARVPSSDPREIEFQAVLHELEVHQVELEMQNRELRDSRNALEESHDRYANLYDFSPVGYMTLDDQGLIKEVNLTAASMLGVERRWLENRMLAPWVSGPEVPGLRLHLKKCARTSEKVTSILHLVTKEKRKIPVELSSVASPDAITGESLIRTSISDLTERRNAEEERDRFFDLSRDLLCVVGPHGFFKRLNPAWEKLLGYSREELMARPYIDFLHPDDRERTALEFAGIMRGEKLPSNFQNRYIRKDRSIIWLTWSGVISGSTFYGVARDTTAETLEKQSILNQSAWLKEMVQSLPIPLVLAEAATGKLLSMSEKCKDLVEGFPAVGLNEATPQGFTFSDSSGKPLNQQDWPRFRAARGETLNGEQMIWQTPQKRTHLQVWSRIIPAKYDHPDMVVIALQDIDPLIEKEVLLEESIKSLDRQRELREDFVAALSHDLRTPLTSARLGVQMLARTSNDPASLGKHTARAISSIDRMDRMICDLLDANRIHAGEKLPLKLNRLDLARLARSTVEALSIIHKNRLKVIADERILVNCSKTHIRRVIENLVNNAVKYGTSDKPVTVKVEKLQANRVCISVHNCGNPISPKDQETLFEQFRRTEEAQQGGKKGWGVGLTLVRGIVEAHGGNITVQSSPARGTTFTVVLPLNAG